MGSLAVAASAVVFSIILAGVASLVFAAVRLRWPAALAGACAILAGGWLMITVPTLGVLAATVMSCGTYAVWRAMR